VPVDRMERCYGPNQALCGAAGCVYKGPLCPLPAVFMHNGRVFPAFYRPICEALHSSLQLAVFSKIYFMNKK
jgi:hypothetical protein